jgi:hypothetical protein
MNARTSIRRLSLFAIAVFASAPSIDQAATDNATLTVGRLVLAPCGGGSSWYTLSGYSSGAFGSYSPTGLTGGKTVLVVQELTCIVAVNISVAASGFAVDPGQLWITSISCNGVTKTGLSATGFSYSGGTANWTWSGSFGLASKAVGANVSCSIVHT